jgi:hypothetical protein
MYGPTMELKGPAEVEALHVTIRHAECDRDARQASVSSVMASELLCST